MSAKRVLGFLVCRSAFTQRNVTSIVLVAIFFGAYIAAGGKITTSVPKFNEARGLGAGLTREGGLVEPGASARQNFEDEQSEQSGLSPKESKKLLGVVPSEDRRARTERTLQRGQMFTPEERRQLEREPIDESGLIEGADFTNRRDQWRLERSEPRPTDSLSDIEERLRIRRRR